MNILFIHQNFPAQYRYIALAYASVAGNRVVALAQRHAGRVKGVQHVIYKLPRAPRTSEHPYVRDFETKVHHGHTVLRALAALKQRGFAPDVILSHPGWGEDLFVADVYPDVPRLIYTEFFYHAHGADVNFDPEQPLLGGEEARIRARNAGQLVSLESATWGVSPTAWQRRQYPDVFQPRITVLHDGIDAERARPDEGAQLTLPDGTTLGRADEVVTYAVRNLEPYRGFHQFVRAARLILERRPRARIVVCGGDAVSYGRRLAKGQTYRQFYMAEAPIDESRIHFLGRLPYDEYLRVLQVSQVHIYLTVPFVLSWSMLEAMSSAALVIGSATPPVEEVIEDGRNGLLCDFFSPADIADKVDQVLDHPDRMAALRTRARQTILDRFALSRMLPRQLKLVEAVAARALPPKLD
jgi:glycosyltransferase involved in cell wall biosynthesis